MLGRHIGCDIGIAHQACGAGHIHNAPVARCCHGGQHLLYAKHGASEVDIDHLLPVRSIHLHKRCAAGLACVVDQDIDSTLRLYSLRKRGFYL